MNIEHAGTHRTSYFIYEADKMKTGCKYNVHQMCYIDLHQTLIYLSNHVMSLPGIHWLYLEEN